MKNRNILMLMSFMFATMVLSSCNQEIDHLYKEKSRIQFKYYTLDFNKKMIFKDKSTFSFGMIDEKIIKDTARIVVEFLGKASDKDRTYKIRVAADSTTAVVGVHYEPISTKQIFRAGRLKDTLKIVVDRTKLSTSFTNPEDRRIALDMVPSEDFDLGMKGGLRTYLYINNYLSEPIWWKYPLRLPYIGFYHPKKWKILISFNEKFSNSETCEFDYNNQGRSYFTGLASYLNAVPTFDDESGARIYIDRLVPKI
ncbi:DUF4843 domain-containing protein [Pedobacter nyackensis]|uniref:DUF4843 domain-containing protein n=1 Tax=Pedobacter nyackensis TaxID=475255 RepID=A0A1W2ADV8_9SPHI|nr:DUF4843 domain-containing protein [Pedobacter nyackensis]SMC58458.1 protein of unknown function [Pedobacter nyackensis]